MTANSIHDDAMQNIIQDMEEQRRRQEAGLCNNCGLHKATIDWAGDHGPMAITHRYLLQRWCDHCTLTVQLERARKRAEEIPELERKLAEACK
jgi:hypothetical protein